MLKLGIYKHSKTGKQYRVLGVAKHGDSLEDLVVYEALYKNNLSSLWVRPLAMFQEKVLVKGKKVNRFVFIKKE